MNERFVKFYEVLGAPVVALTVARATSVSVSPYTVRQWAHLIRSGKSLPRWAVPQMPAMITALEGAARDRQLELYREAAAVAALVGEGTANASK